ncbi:MAG: hypothetical protein ABSG04_12535 [Verrucomicrobiota bacterium]
MNKSHPHENAVAPSDPAASIPPEIQLLLDKAPRPIRSNFHLWLEAVLAMDAAKHNRRIARIYARRLGVRPSYLWTKRAQFRKHGHIVLLDRRWTADLWAGRPEGLPRLAVECLKKLAVEQKLPAAEAIRAFKKRLWRWRRGDSSARIPGYASPPEGKTPAGWSWRNLARFIPSRSRTPAPGPALLKFETTIRRQGNALVYSTRQTFPKAAALARSAATFNAALP